MKLKKVIKMPELFCPLSLSPEDKMPMALLENYRLLGHARIMVQYGQSPYTEDWRERSLNSQKETRALLEEYVGQGIVPYGEDA